MICPKCGRPVEERAVICRGCDFILDTDFLGGDILDEEHQLRPGQGGVDPAVFNLADAVILGNIGDDTSSFETSDSGFHLKKDLQAARLYVSGRSQAVMAPDAVIALINAGEKVRLTPFEKHVLRFIDGKRPVESIRRQAGLDEAEVKTALANLADKGVIKVVGRALADAADFDVDTAPGNAPRNKPRRVRGTLVGAVVVVGDAADQAIDDAFRTQVRTEGARPDLQLKDDGNVFSESEAESSLPSVGSEDIDSFDAGTDEIKSRRRPPTSSTSTVRPAGMRGAINAGGLTGRMVAPVLSDVDASDGFDDFGEASDVATAMVQQPSLSEESSLPGLDVLPRGGVFSDPSPLVGGNLSDLDDFDDPGVDDLADSRVEPRPILPPLPSPDTTTPVAPMTPRAAPPALPSLSEASEADRLSASAEASLNDVERAAFSGGVWDDDLGPNPNPSPSPSPNPNDDDAPTAAQAPYPQPRSSRKKSEHSTSLSQLLDDDSESESGEDIIEAPTHNRRPGVVDSEDEPTAFRPPPAAMPLVARRRSEHGDGPPAGPPPISVEEPQPIREAWEEETPRGAPPLSLQDPPSWDEETPRAPAVALPAPTADIDDVPVAPLDRAGAADDLFPDDDEDDFNVPTEARPAQALPLRQPEGPDPDLTAPPSMLAEDDDDDDDGDSAWSSSQPARREQPPPPEPSRFESRAQDSQSRGTPVLATEHFSAPSGLGPSLLSEETLAPSVPSRNAPRGAPPAGIPRRDLERPERPEHAEDRANPTANIRKPNPSSSAEILDSAMVIRPAIKAVPLALAAKKAKARSDSPEPPPPPTPAVRDVEDDGEFMVDPDATLNLPAMPKSQEGAERRRKKAGPNSQPSQPSEEPEVHAEEDGQDPKKNPRAPTEDMRRKARNLFEQAEKDHAVGRIGAARMNCKLATIYDPDNDRYRKVLSAWEDRPRGGGADGGSVSGVARPEYAALYEQAQDLEDEDDIEGALELLERGVRLAPNAAAFHNRIGVILAMRKRDFERAADEIQKAIALDPDNPHYRNNLGKVLSKANRRRGGDAVANAR